MSIRLLTDAALLAECRSENFRGPGPGGQKRNKTSNAVRITHLPTGVHASAGEFRSLAINKLHALRRLRIKIAAERREPIDLLTFEPPDWSLLLRHEKRINVSHRDALHGATGGLVLDLLAALGGNPSLVAINLGVSLREIIRVLEDEPVFWIAANRIRKDAGLGPLTHR
jgi:hypothetical protein